MQDRTFIEPVEEIAFDLDRFFQRIRHRKQQHRMMTAGKAIAQQELLVAGIKEDYVDRHADVLKIVEKLHIVHCVGRQGDVVITLIVLLADQMSQRREQLHRKIIDAVIPHIL